MSSGEELRKQTQRLRDRLSNFQFNQRKKQAQATSSLIQHDVIITVTFWSQLVRAGWWIYQKLIRPILRFFVRIVSRLWDWYRRQVWDRFALYTDKFGDRQFSTVRGGLVGVATLIFLWFVPTIMLFGWDALLYITTVRHQEEVYLTGSQEIYPDDNIHAVKGCDELPCTDHNSVYFRIQPVAFNHLWALWHNGSIFFPDFVAAAVPKDTSKCSIISYGIRWKFLMRSADLYRDLLAASCQPVRQ